MLALRRDAQGVDADSNVRGAAVSYGAGPDSEEKSGPLLGLGGPARWQSHSAGLLPDNGVMWVQCFAQLLGERGGHAAQSPNTLSASVLCRCAIWGIIPAGNLERGSSIVAGRVLQLA